MAEFTFLCDIRFHGISPTFRLSYIYYRDHRNQYEVIILCGILEDRSQGFVFISNLHFQCLINSRTNIELQILLLDSTS